MTLRARVFGRALVALAVVAISGAAFAEDPAATDGSGPEARRGPADIRDDHLLAQPRLTLPATSPHTVPRGDWTVDVSLLLSNSFSWTQDVRGENPADRRFLIDGEALTLATTLRRGLGRHVDLGLRVPVQHRGGGVLDGFIDSWHRVFRAEDAARPVFLRDAFRIEGSTTDEQHFSWTPYEGTGLGSVQLDVRWRTLDGGSDRTSLALVGRLSLPTATEPYDRHGLGAGAQLVVATPLGRTTDLYAGVGLSVQDPGPVRGLEYSRTRAQGFAAFEWRPWRRVSMIVETNAASRLVENIDSYAGVHWLVNLVGRVDLGRAVRLDVGVTENLIAQQSTTDFGLFFALGWRP